MAKGREGEDQLFSLLDNCFLGQRKIRDKYGEGNSGVSIIRVKGGKIAFFPSKGNASVSERNVGHKYHSTCTQKGTPQEKKGNHKKKTPPTQLPTYRTIQYKRKREGRGPSSSFSSREESTKAKPTRIEAIFLPNQGREGERRCNLWCPFLFLFLFLGGRAYQPFFFLLALIFST